MTGASHTVFFQVRYLVGISRLLSGKADKFAAMHTALRFAFLSAALIFAFDASAQKPEGYYLNAVNSVNAGDFDQAFGELNKALELDPYHPQSRILRAYLFLKAGDKEKALDDYSAALESAPGDLGALTNRALIYMEFEEYEKAEKDLRERLKGDPHNWMASYDLAYCFGLMGKYDQAIQGFDEVITRKPDYAEAYLNRAFARYNKHSNGGLTPPDAETMDLICADIQQAAEMESEEAREAMENYCPE